MNRRNISRILAGMFLFATVLGTAFAFTTHVDTQAASYAKKITVKLADGQDATAEIQKALDEAEKAGTKKKQALVSIPAGTYYISRTLNIGSNTCLSLDKKTVIRKNPKPKDPILYMLRSKPGNKGGYSDTAKITITGGTWDAGFIPYNDKSGGSLFFFAHTNNLKITGVTLCNNFGTHLIEMGGVKKCTIKNCTLYGFKAPDEDTDKEAIQLDICHSDSILPAGGPFDDTPCTDITVTGCEIYDYPRAIGTHMMVDRIYHDKISVTKNNFHDISAAAVYGYNYTNVTIKNNTMTNVGSGVQIKTDSDVKKTKLDRNSGVKAMSVSKGKFNIKIVDNTITLLKKEEAGGGYGVFIYGSTENPMKGITISGNEFLCNAAGIYLRYVNDASILNNVIDRHVGAIAVDKTSFTEDAVKFLSCNGAVVDSNRISTIHEEKYENGIAMRDGCKDATLLNNTINGTTKSGIALFGQSSVIKAENIFINNAGMYGINIDNSAFNLTGGTVNGAKEYGIMVDSAGKLVINDYEISSCGKRGINVKDNGSFEAVNVKIRDCTEKCLDIAQNCKAVITDCEISDGGKYGIDIDKDSLVVITGSTFSGNKEKGINIRNSVYADVQNCRILNNSGKGVDIGSESTVTLKDCTINGSGAKGVDIGSGSTVKLDTCTLSENTGRAVDIAEKTSVEIFSCIIEKTRTDAVNVDGSGATVTVTACQIFDNDGEGMHLKNGRIDISGNVIKNNCIKETDGNAVKIFSGITGSFTDNTLSNPNSKNEIKVDGATLSPAIPTTKTGKVAGTADIGGNKFE
ncbi:MAG: right-handed parallel beta-helix repeat-containing protein [Lachnospiraceae bacterium]|nr:right-handed parallel beta-helix repeat-containing protein [Lachnospiraceae bacterium]